MILLIYANMFLLIWPQEIHHHLYLKAAWVLQTEGSFYGQ